MSNLLTSLFDPNFMPHGHCYFWRPAVLWLNVVSDGIIGVAYYSIPVALYVFAKKRTDLAFNWIFILFAIFILACGTTHFIEIWNIWNGDYGLAGLVKLLTAVVSIVTAVLLWPLLPKALALPSPKQLRQKVEEATSELRDALNERKVLLEREQVAREEAEQANRMKDEFLATLSHELRTPLNAMLGWVQLINRGRLEPDKFREGLSVVEKNARLQSRIIDDLLDMNRIVSGKTKLDLCRVDLALVVREVAESIRPMAEIKGVQVYTSLQEGSFVRGDSGRIMQIVWNLLNNAVKFTENGGKVEVFLSSDVSSVCLKVRDTGKGIRREFIPFVFDKFRQEDSSSARSHGGLGLGLSIVKHLTELHGGRITVESDGDQCGATFTLVLPSTSGIKEVPAVHIEGASDQSVEGASIQGKRIVVIDDRTEALELTRLQLQHLGAVVFGATNANDGLSLVREHLPHVVISDIGMPGQDGYEFIRMLRGVSATEGGDTPAIALTAFARPEDRSKILMAGYQSHVTKPLDADELVAAVTGLLRL